MAQITSGIRSLLSQPLVYDFLQMLMGASSARHEFVNKFIRPEAQSRVLDIGCGTAELLAFLPEYVDYVGYDPSEKYIAHAKQRYFHRGKFNIGLYDASEASRNSPFDIVIASGVLHHMDDHQVTEIMKLAHNSLCKGGRLVTIDPVLCSKQNVFARILIDMDRGQNVRTDNEYKKLANSVFSSVAGIIKYRKWIPYTHWIMECQK